LNKAETKKKRCRDLRTRIDNLTAKLDLAKYDAVEKEAGFKAEIKRKDALIAQLQKLVCAHDAKYMAVKAENTELKADNERLTGELEKALDTSGRLRASLKKDSSISSRPPSTDGFKKRAARLPKTKSGRKPGGQAGHKGHTLNLYPEPTVVIKKDPPHVCTCGGKVVPLPGFRAKQRVDIRVLAEIIEERALSGRCEGCGKIHEGVFSDGFVNCVQYGTGIKAVVACLNAYANVPVNKTAEFLSSITDGLVCISDGTVVNIIHELADGLAGTIDAIKNMLVAGGCLGVDETGCRVDGKLDWLQIFAGSDCVLFGRNDSRSGFFHEGADLIEMFTGILVHDHLSSYYRYKHLSHAECNSHILRYLKSIIEILKHPWAAGMAKLLREANERREECIENGRDSMEKGESDRIHDEYMQVLDAGDAEYEAAIAGKKNISYYDEERRLLKRMREYAGQHLLFLTDFNAPFTNNVSEHGARFFKSKIKTAGCFRSQKGADDYARVASLIATLRKQKLHVYGTVKDVFGGVPPPFVTVAPPTIG
jgi:transposase